MDLTENTSHYERVYRISTPVILDDSSVKDFALGLNRFLAFRPKYTSVCRRVNMQFEGFGSVR